jgi:hypothetical protein
MTVSTPPKARRAAAEPESVHDLLAASPAAAHLEGEQPSETVELPASELVLRIAHEAGVEDARDPRMALEETCDCERVRASRRQAATSVTSR